MSQYKKLKDKAEVKNTTASSRVAFPPANLLFGTSQSVWLNRNVHPLDVCTVSSRQV